MTVVTALRSLSLPELEERAPLLRRVDVKYLLSRRRFAALLDALADDHDVLEIDDRRRFSYRSVYFDTADLRCFWDHVHGRHPRFKARTRCYLDPGECYFEVKLKTRAGETDKRQVEHPVDADDRVTPNARALLDDTLDAAGVEPVGDVEPVLCTLFDRITLAAREGDARLTCDLRLRLVLPGGGEARLDDELVLVETKSADGRSRADAALAELGVESLDLSKYRTGIDLLVERDPSGATAGLRRCFSTGA
jgi:hypothetical protein